LYTHVYLYAMHWARGREEVFEIFRGMSQDIDAEEKPFSFEVDVLKSQLAPNFTTLHYSTIDMISAQNYYLCTATWQLITALIQQW